MKSMWDERFGQEAYVYGEEANVFFAEQLENLSPKTALFPAEGEGRNAVYAATKGWNSIAYDNSEAGIKKARSLALKYSVQIEYHNSAHQDFSLEKESIDLLVLVFAHVEGSFRNEFHKKLWELVKPGGHLILEGFSKKQLGLASGGPKELGMLFSKDELILDFPETDWIIAREVSTNLSEGAFHQGKAETVQLFGKKKA
jgi:hypothetical protein